MRPLLAPPDARLFLTGQSLSRLGAPALWLALGLWVKELTGSSSAAGLVFLCIAAPGLLSPLGGLLVDRFPRRTVLLCVNPLTALVVLPLLLVRGPQDVWLIYLVTTLYGTSYVILAAGQSALLTTLLPADLLGSANAALQTVRETLRLVAPVAGAGLYTVAGGGAVAILDAATFLAATAALFALHARAPPPEPPATPWLPATAGRAPPPPPRRVVRAARPRPRPGPAAHALARAAARGRPPHRPRAGAQAARAGQRLGDARDRVRRDAAVRAPARARAGRLVRGRADG